MKDIQIWYDDIRRPPYPEDEWVWVRTTKAAIAALELFADRIEVISLDHDMGLEDANPDADPSTYLRDYNPGLVEDNGVKLVEWMIENNVGREAIITIHSWNTDAAKRMKQMFVAANYPDVYIKSFDLSWYDDSDYGNEYVCEHELPCDCPPSDYGKLKEGYSNGKEDQLLTG